MSRGANTVAQFEQADRKGSNFLVTLGNPEYEAFVQNMFKLVRWASGVVRRQRFVNRICPCDTDEMSVEGINLEIAIKLGQYKKLLVVSILKSLVNLGTVENYNWYQS
jgi:histidyl-tRNA synthetase